MSKELVLDVIARKNSRDLNALADDFEKLAAKSELSGKSLDKTTTFSKHLDEQIARTKVQVRELGTEFDRTGNKDVFAKLRGAQSNLRSLEKIRKDLSSAIGQGADDGAKTLFGKLKGVAKSTAEGFKKDFEGTFNEGIGGFFTSPTGLAVAVPAAIVAGQMIGGAVLTGIGLAGIGLGIAEQIHDPKVAAATHRLGAEVSAGLKDATSSFQAPLIEGVHIFSDEWKRLQPGLKSTFTELAPLTSTLARGAAGFVDRLAPGLERAAVASKPLVADLSGWLPKLGSELGSLFSTMAAHSKEAEQGLQMLEDGIDGLVVLTRDAIPVMAKLGDALSYINTVSEIKHAYGIQDDIPHVQGFAGAVYDAAAKVGGFASSEGDAAASSDALAASLAKLSQQIDDTFHKMLSVDQANLAWHKDLTTLVTDIDKHGKTLDQNTAAGQRNIEVLLRLAEDAERTRQAAIDAAGGQNASADAINKANQKYHDQVGQLEALAVKLGLNKDAVKRLLDQYLNLVDAPNIFKTITITQQVKSAGGPGSSQYNQQVPYAARRAGGGPVEAGVPYVVGEHRPELFVPKTAGYIVPSVPTGRRYGTAGAMRTGTVKLDITLRSDDGRILQVIRREVSSAFGGDVQAALGQVA